MDRPTNKPLDKRDSTINGIVVGLAVTFIGWFIFNALNKFVPSMIPEMADGFSDSLIVMMAVVSNIIPVQMFNKQGRGLAMRGVITVILIGVAAWFVYYKTGLING